MVIVQLLINYVFVIVAVVAFGPRVIHDAL